MIHGQKPNLKKNKKKNKNSWVLTTSGRKVNFINFELRLEDSGIMTTL